MEQTQEWKWVYSVMYSYRVSLEAEVAGPYLGSEVHLTTTRNQVLNG